MKSTQSKRELKQNYGGMKGAVTDLGLDSYATAWRYLGVYTDCSSSGSSSSSWKWWGGNGKNSSSIQCSGGTRKLLWAVVRPFEFVYMWFGSIVCN